MSLIPNSPAPSRPDAADANPGSGPVGQGDHLVHAGDCMFSIAFEAGHDWQKLWNLGENADLKRAREFPNRLLPGDRVTVPEITLRKETCSVDARHKFRLKNVPVQLVLRVMKPPDLKDLKAPQEAPPTNPDETLDVTGADPDPPAKQDDQPWADIDYRLDVDDHSFTGKTDAEGKISADISPGARSATLFLNLEGHHEGGTRSIPLQLGGLAPHGELTGIKQRLLHLAFDCGDTNNSDQSDNFLVAIAAFREKHGLGPGGLDQALIDNLKTLHGS